MKERRRGNYSRVDSKICLFCEHFKHKPESEYDNAGSMQEAQSYDGRCYCLPHIELVKQDHSCGQFKDYESIV